MRLPNFIVIGAAKSATTSLHGQLLHHPDVFLSDPKEPEFFARDDNYAKGIDSYATLFEGAGEEQVAGEMSTIYTMVQHFPKTPERIATHLPDARLVYMLRHPVQRAYSYYTQLIKGYQRSTHDLTVNRTFEEFILPDAHAAAAPRHKAIAPHNGHLPDVPDLCTAASDYVTQIEAYLAHVPRDRMLFLLFEDYRRDPRAVLDQLTDFIGVRRLSDAEFCAGAGAQNTSAEHYGTMSKQKTIQRIKSVAGPLWNLRRLLPDAARDRLSGAVSSAMPSGGVEPPPMLPKTRQMLEDRFRADLPRLQELTGLDLSAWKLCPDAMTAAE
ncbi:MAG: sulfotransferase domain-containing protein [Pseudomonadota bacterium]